MSKKPLRKPNKEIKTEVRYFTLPKEENDKRIERLTRTILRGLRYVQNESSSAEEPEYSVSNSTHELFAETFEKRLGM